MKKLTHPKETVDDIINLIKGDYTLLKKQKEIEDLRSTLITNEKKFEQKVISIELHRIKKTTTVNNIDIKKQLLNYYENRLLKKDLSARVFYDKLISSVDNNECPFCTIREISTIDHFLPKAEYPLFSITPFNLVPCCSDCNKTKLTDYPTSSENQLFHPYFDDVEKDIWIKATLMQSEPPYFNFEVIKPINWDDVKFERAKYHFKSYQLNQLFSSYANKELRGDKYSFKTLFDKDKKLLLEDLSTRYESNKRGLGVLYWKTIMYDELRNNQWFLDGCKGSTYFK